MLRIFQARRAMSSVSKLRWNLTPADLKELAAKTMSDYKTSLDQVVAVQGPRTWQNTIQPLNAAECLFGWRGENVAFPQQVSPDPDVRTASSEADKELSDFMVESSMREDVHQAVEAYKQTGTDLPTEGEDRRFLEHILRDFRRDGLALPKEKREQLEAMKKKLSQNSITFSSNLANDTSFIACTKEELKGMPDDWLSGLKVIEEGEDKGKYRVTTKYPDQQPVMKLCEVEETRKRMDRAFNNRCLDLNVTIAEETFALRHRAAVLLGYKDHRQFILELRMAKTPERVEAFYADLKPKLDGKARQELQELAELKKADPAAAGSEPVINAWDFNYYHTKLLKEKYGVDEEAIKDYFPLDRVIAETLSIYQELLGLKFTKVEEPAWHEQVTCYRVEDSSDGELKGLFYLDLHPRPGKYGHAAVFGLQGGCLDENGEKQYPVRAMVCNFTEATPEKPSVLRHSEFETFFHEFGHVVHGVLGHTKYNRFSGTHTERDFVECPSQALENWCWEKSILTRVSQHFKTGEKLPEDVIDRMIGAKLVNTALLNLRQVFFGVLDQTVHSQEVTNTAETWAKLRTEITLIPHPEGVNPTANFGHLLGGYDASYYGYLWSEVFSADIFAQFTAAGSCMDPNQGKRYRKYILEPGGSDDAEKYLRNFLGRDPTTAAFLAQIGC